MGGWMRSSRRTHGLADIDYTGLCYVVTVTIPAERLGSVKLAERDALVDIAIGLYKREEISIGRASELAGISTVEFLSELARRHISVNYDIQDLRSDVTTLKKILER
jgi:predicted HTH domain antitoxin